MGYTREPEDDPLNVASAEDLILSKLDWARSSRSARVLMIADIRTQNPGITDGELRVKLFERTYGNDFDAADYDRIVARIRRG